MTSDIGSLGETASNRRPSGGVWAGRALSGLAILALTMDAVGKLAVPDMMIANSPPLGLPADPAFHRLLGAILAVSIALYAWPRTAVLGAILLTGFLGGAVLAHLRVGSPLATFTRRGLYWNCRMGRSLAARSARPRAAFIRPLSCRFRAI